MLLPEGRALSLLPIRLKQNWRNHATCSRVKRVRALERSLLKMTRVAQGRTKGEQRGKLPRAPRCKGAPSDEIYLFQMKYSFEKFRDSEVIQEYGSLLLYIPMFR